MNDVLPCSYAELEEALQGANAESGAAESHGLVNGMICAAGNAESADWLEHLLGEDNALSSMALNCRDMLLALHSDTLLHLNEGDPGLVLLLPDDDVPLPERSEALGQWCQGFLYGLALGGIRDDSDLPDPAGEILRDFYEISNTSFDYEAADEADEEAYMEIVEYVRMSVLLLYEELQPSQNTDRLH